MQRIVQNTLTWRITVTVAHPGNEQCRRATALFGQVLVCCSGGSNDWTPCRCAAS